MLMFSRKKNRSILGVDISSTSVKIIEISNSRDQYCVEGYARIPLAHALNDTGSISACIKTLLSNVNFLSTQAVIAVPDSAAISKIIQINTSVHSQDIEEWVLMEAEKFIPYPLDEISLDYNLLGSSLTNVEQLDILVVACRTETITQRVEIIHRAGLVAQIVDVESFAIERALRFLSISGGSGKYTALFDVGHLYSRCYIFNGINIVFSREDALGQGLLFDVLLQQLKRTLQFYFSTRQHDSIEQIILAGNLADFSKLARFFHEHLGLPTHIVNPFTKMTFSTAVNLETIEKDAPMLVVACGLALHGLETSL